MRGWTPEDVKILIVDDIPANLEIVGSILENHGYDVYAADSGQTALELLEHVAIDLVLLDIMMPDLDGFETCSKIRSDDRFTQVPIIFLTAKVDVESIERGFRCGAVDYIRKPFNALELLMRVKTQIQIRELKYLLSERE